MCICCRQALSVYRGRSWGYIEEHIHDTLGRTFRDSGDLQSAVDHLMAVLPCPDAAVALQGRYLQQFLDVVHQLGAKQVAALKVSTFFCLGPCFCEQCERQLQQAAIHVQDAGELTNKH